MIIGYARVSTADQDLAAQIETLKTNGAENIYQEKVSGAKSDRAELGKLLNSLKPGDVLVVTRLDRLARSTLDLLGILKLIGDAGATFKSLSEGWADTTTAVGRLVITVLGGIAEFERELIKARTGDGRARAKAAGRRIGGPKPKLTKRERELILVRVRANEPYKSIAKDFNISASTICRLEKLAA